MSNVKPSIIERPDPRVYITASANWSDLIDGLEKLIAKCKGSQLPSDGPDRLINAAHAMRQRLRQ